MKIRIYPKKATIMGRLTQKLEGLQKDHDAAVKVLQAKKESLLFVPEQEINFLVRSIDAFVSDIAEIEETIATLASHDPPDVMAEFEV